MTVCCGEVFDKFNVPKKKKDHKKSSQTVFDKLQELEETQVLKSQ